MELADKRQIRFQIKRLEQVKTWQLIVLLVMSAFITATFLRLNNVGMIERRDAVEAADKSGDEVVLQQRLYDLQRYVSSHMNADPGRIPLENTYKRALDREFKKFESRVQNSDGVVGKVREICDAEARAGGWGHYTTAADPRYVDCINREHEKMSGAEAAESQFTAPSTVAYYQTFTSPRWSPDFAGWSLIITAVIALIIVFRFVMLLVLKFMVSRKYQQV